MATKKKVKDLDIRYSHPFVSEVPIPINDDTWHDRCQQMAGALKLVEIAEERIAKVKADYKEALTEETAKLNEANEELSRLADIVRTRAEPEERDVRWRFILNTCEKQKVLADDLEHAIGEPEAMSEDELERARQNELEFED